MAQILKGAPVVAAMNEANAARCAALKEKGIVPTLAVVRVGAREDDISYEKGIVTRCGKVGVEVRQFHLAENQWGCIGSRVPDLPAPAKAVR